METQTKTRTFNAPEPPAIPTTSNVYRVTAVGETYKSQKESGYSVTPFTLSGLGAAKELKLWMVFRPQWLKFEFNVKTLEGLKGSPDRIYASNINNGDNGELAMLQALAGSEEGFGELCNALDGIDVDPDKDEAGYYAEVTRVLTEYFDANKPLVGAVLKQRNERTEDVDPETGKNIWKRTKWTDVHRYFYPTDKKLEQERKLAERSAKKIQEIIESNASGGKYQQPPVPFKVTFDEDVPF